MPRYRHPCLEGEVSGRDRFGRRPRPQERRLGAGPGSLPRSPDLAPPPAHHPAPRFPPDAGGPRSLSDVTPRAEVTFSRGWTRRLVAGQGRACGFFSGDIHIIFVTGVGRGRGVTRRARGLPPRPSSPLGGSCFGGASCRPKPPGEQPPPPPHPLRRCRRRRRRRPLLRRTPNRTVALRTCLWPGERAKPLRRPASEKGARRMRRGWRRGVWRGRVFAGGRVWREGGPSLSPTAAQRLEKDDRGLGLGSRGGQPEGVWLRLDRCRAGGARVPERSDRCRLSSAGLQARRRRVISRPHQTREEKNRQRLVSGGEFFLRLRFVVLRWSWDFLFWSPGMQQL